MSVNLPDDLGSMFADLDRRIRSLETSPGIPGLSVESIGGHLTPGQIVALGIPTFQPNVGYSVFFPAVPTINATIGPSGRVLVFWGGNINLQTGTSPTNNSQLATVSFAMSGANTQAAGVGGKAQFEWHTASDVVNATVGAVWYGDSLLPGVTTFSLRGSLVGGVTGSGAILQSPWFIVIPI